MRLAVVGRLCTAHRDRSICVKKPTSSIMNRSVTAPGWVSRRSGRSASRSCDPAHVNVLRATAVLTPVILVLGLGFLASLIYDIAVLRNLTDKTVMLIIFAGSQTCPSR